MKQVKRFWKLNKLWIYLALPLIFILLILSLTDTIANGKVMAASAIVGTIYLVLSLVPANLKFLLKGNKVIKKLTQKRREIGISSGILFVFHSIFGIIHYLDFGSGDLPPVQYLFGAFSNYIFIFLLITSFFGIRAKWKSHWNLWHGMVWLTLPLILMHAGLNHKIYEGSFLSPVVIVYFLLIIFSFAKSFLPNSFNKDDLKRDYFWAILGLILTGAIIVSSFGQIQDILNPSTDSSSGSAGDTLVLDDESKENLSTLNFDEVSQNNTSDNCFIAFNNIVYDVTDYISSHPGGRQIIDSCGKDISYLEQIHSPSIDSEQFQDVLAGREVGILNNE